MAMLLTEVFMGGPEISLRVKEEQVERIFHLVTSGGNALPELMDTLQSIVKVCVDYIHSCMVMNSQLYLPFDLSGRGPGPAHQT